jgi:hypothetical protein
MSTVWRRLQTQMTMRNYHEDMRQEENRPRRYKIGRNNGYLCRMMNVRKMTRDTDTKGVSENLDVDYVSEYRLDKAYRCLPRAKVQLQCCVIFNGRWQYAINRKPGCGAGHRH